AQARAQIVDLVQFYFAPLNVRVTTERPSAGGYTMAMIGSTAGSICSVADCVGWGPIDCDDQNDRDIVFVFSRTLGEDPVKVATVIAHEPGHAYGLAHVTEPTDLMYPAVRADQNGFHDAMMDADHRNESGGACVTATQQNDVTLLTANVGRVCGDNTPP